MLSQGGPLSLLQFMVYMDIYAIEMAKYQTEEHRQDQDMINYDIVLFADDIKIQARTKRTLQNLLDFSSALVYDVGRYGVRPNVNC